MGPADKVREFVATLVESGVARPADIRRCTPEDLAALDARVGPLPAAYAEFLRVAGRGAGQFWLGSDAFFPALLDLGPDDLDELARDMGVDLPRDRKLVFFSHQGYELRWLSDPSDSDDPPVWQLLEGRPAPRMLAASFTDLLLANARATRERPPGR